MQLVSDVINSYSRDWDHGKLMAAVGTVDSQHILSIPISSTDMEDTLVWHHSIRGIYDVKSGYRVAVEAKQSAASSGASSSFWHPRNFWKEIWSTPIPPKICNFWWRVCGNKLATKENLFRRHCATSQNCLICNASVESIEHLLFGCDWTRAVWFRCDLGQLSRIRVGHSAKSWTLSIMEQCSNARGT